MEFTGFHPFNPFKAELILAACPQIALKTNCDFQVWDTRIGASRPYSLLRITGYREEDIDSARKAIDSVAMREDLANMAAYSKMEEKERVIAPICRFFYYLPPKERQYMLKDNKILEEMRSKSNCLIVETVVDPHNEYDPPIFFGGKAAEVKKAKDLLFLRRKVEMAKQQKLCRTQTHSEPEVCAPMHSEEGSSQPDTGAPVSVPRTSRTNQSTMDQTRPDAPVTFGRPTSPTGDERSRVEHEPSPSRMSRGTSSRGASMERTDEKAKGRSEKRATPYSRKWTLPRVPERYSDMD